MTQGMSGRQRPSVELALVWGIHWCGVFTGVGYSLVWGIHWCGVFTGVGYSLVWGIQLVWGIHWCGVFTGVGYSAGVKSLSVVVPGKVDVWWSQGSRCMVR